MSAGTMAAIPSVVQKNNLLTLPPEIREQIYSLILNPDANRVYRPNEYTSYSFSAALVLFKINRQIYLESRKIFYDINVFVRVETPWPQSKEHLQIEGHVPIVIRDSKASKFQNYKLCVGIDAPEYELLDMDTECFVVLANDLPKFAKCWYYADLTHPSLNSNLRLTLRLHDPFTPEWEEKRMSKALQSQLLLPWSHIKNLRSLRISGDLTPYSSVETELKTAQAVPHSSAEHCLRESARLKEEGNAELKAGRYQSALDAYNKAWEAIHITIRGRVRHVHADAFFAVRLSEPPYQQRSGQSERLILRVQLVANTCLAYFKMENYEECKFWGLRTINTLREAMGMGEDEDISPEDEAVPTFPAAPEMGKIYWRTALAFKAEDHRSEARRLLKVAKIYLTGDADQKALDQALQGCMLKLG